MPQTAIELTAMALTAKQRNAVQLISLGWNRGRVAQKLEVDPATLSRWRKLPDFNQMLEAQLLQLDEEVRLELQALRGAAVDRLAELLHSKNPTVALRAIAIISGAGAASLVKGAPEACEASEADRCFDGVLSELSTLCAVR